jgi:hypothetical protein
MFGRPSKWAVSASGASVAHTHAWCMWVLSQHVRHVTCKFFPLFEQSRSSPRLLDVPLRWVPCGLPLWAFLLRSNNEPSPFYQAFTIVSPRGTSNLLVLSSSSPSTDFSPQQWWAGRCRSPWRTSLLGGRSADARCLLHACSCSRYSRVPASAQLPSSNPAPTPSRGLRGCTCLHHRSRSGSRAS